MDDFFKQVYQNEPSFLSKLFHKLRRNKVTKNDFAEFKEHLDEILNCRCAVIPENDDTKYHEVYPFGGATSIDLPVGDENLKFRIIKDGEEVEVTSSKMLVLDFKYNLYNKVCLN